jgi:ABC-type branched-subunit amino acid transport system substrate-binding protein
VRRATLLLLAVLAALATGCGDDAPESDRVSGATLTVYASLPGHGEEAAAGRAAEIGMRRALTDAGGRAGERRIRFVPLSSTRPEDETWDPGTVEANAERAVDDATTIAYLGELDQGGSAVSLPVTNRVGILQVALADGLTSFTRMPPGRPRAGPERYYPDGNRTFVRLVPPDVEVAREVVRSLRARGARRLAVVHGDGIADRELEAMVLAVIGAGLPRNVLRADAGDGDPEEAAELAEEVATARPDAILYAGPAGPAAAAELAALATRLPGVPVVGGPPLAQGGGFERVPEEACALTGVPRASRLPARGDGLLRRMRRAGGGPLGAEALLGYEAMRLTLEAIDAGGPDRSRVVRAARRPGERDGALGTYVVTGRGDVEDRPLTCVDLAASAR